MSVEFQAVGSYKVTTAKVNNFNVLIIGGICQISGLSLITAEKLLIYYQPKVRPKI